MIGTSLVAFESDLLDPSSASKTSIIRASKVRDPVRKVERPGDWRFGGRRLSADGSGEGNMFGGGLDMKSTQSDCAHTNS